MSKKSRKVLSFSTTMRNPERMAEFIGCLKNYEGQILTEDVIMEVVKQVITYKLYKPMYITRDDILKSIHDDEVSFFTEVQVEDIINNSPQNHKEKGFPKGWPSRFDTWYKLCKELGFIYYEMNQKIEISSAGHMLYEAYGSELKNSGERIQRIFLNALAKYQTNNPFRKNLNTNVPIPLLLNLLKLLKLDDRGAGIHRKELPFLMCWKNNDFHGLYEFIVGFRNQYGFKASDEIVYEKCLELLESDNRTRFKMNQIVKEGVDDLIRKLRVTGLFSLRGMGRFIDINSLEIKTAEYIINKYTNFKCFENEYLFYQYMSNLDEVILSSSKKDFEGLKRVKINSLKYFSEQYSLSEVNYELKLLESNKASKDEYLKLIDGPTRLEFLTSLALVIKFPNYIIVPNYSIDDEGNPTFTAKGGVADIEVYSDNMESLVEVTLMKNKQQASAEIPAITRHLKELRSKSVVDNVFSVFVAPNLHEDTIYMCRFTMYHEKLGIYPYTISRFMNEIESKSDLVELKYDV